MTPGRILCFLVQPQASAGEVPLKSVGVLRSVPTLYDVHHSSHVTNGQAAKYYGVSEKDVVRNLNGGDLVPAKVQGKQVYLDFRHADVWESWKETALRRLKNGEASLEPATGVVRWEPNTSVPRGSNAKSQGN